MKQHVVCGLYLTDTEFNFMRHTVDVMLNNGWVLTNGYSAPTTDGWWFLAVLEPRTGVN